MHVNEHEKLSNNTLKWDSPYGMQRFEELPFKMKEEVYMLCERSTDRWRRQTKCVSQKLWQLENTYDFSPTNS